MDDTCCILKTGDMNGLLDHFNGIQPTTKFAMKLEEEGSLPFLDTRVTITRLADDKLDITVKKRHTDRSLPFNSHHPRGT